MNTRKTTLIVAIALIALAVLPTAISAEVTVDIGDVTIVNSTVTVPITVSEASNIGAMDIMLEYDSSVIEFTGIEKGTVTSDALLVVDDTIYNDPDTGYDAISSADNDTVRNFGAIAGDSTGNKVNISLISTEGFNGDGTLATLTFSMVAGCGGNSSLLLSAVANETATCAPDCTDETVFDPASYPAIPIVTEDGFVSTLSGDANGDGTVSMDELFAAIDAYITDSGDMSALFCAIDNYVAMA
ncbi:MAG: hypothetical protein EF813_11585 [Methanosarcinales archaeon]|nr:MAG: hypothetical protein EF813_11585 [Methanosarcinales archaeon]